MADGFDISLIGDRQLDRAFAQLPLNAQRKALRTAQRKAIKPIQQAINRKIPIDTGLLKSKGARVRAGRRSRREIRLMVLLPTRDQLGIRPEDRYYYPAAVEYGHPIVRNGRIVGHVPPKSFVRAGFDQMEATALNILREELAEGIEREARRLAK